MYLNGTGIEPTMPPIQLKIFKIGNKYTTAKLPNATVNDVEIVIGESSKSTQRSVVNKRRKIHPIIKATDFLTSISAPSQTETWLHDIPTNNIQRSNTHKHR